RELPKPGASLRHELRTPLHTLLGVARVLGNKLARDGALGPGDAELLQLIVTEAERLDGMFENLGE
ncbi:MAG TPA: histidine kinase dimerization/phospho-acceptor domain-containing protein, partial [Aggregatilineales bacterium]|nr:histidine kinase dimerization/phospho-acceptor domain-containing protein [Aggregatilineales bacterium]